MKLYIIKSHENHRRYDDEEAPQFWRRTENNLWQPVADPEHATRFAGEAEVVEAVNELQALGEYVVGQVDKARALKD